MKILKNYLYNSFYQILILIIPFITIPYVTRVLGDSNYGINSFTNSITQYFVILGSIGITLYGNRTIAYVSDDKDARSEKFWEIFWLKFFTMTISIAAFFIFILLGNGNETFYLCQSFLLFSALFDISWYFVGREDFKKTVLRNSLVKISSLILIFVFVKTSTDLWKYILINSLSLFVGQLTLWPYLKNEIYFKKVKLNQIAKHFPQSLALFVPQIAVQIYGILNKTLLGIFGTMSEVGNFEAADKTVTIVMTLVTSLGTIMLPRIANSFAKKDFTAINRYMENSFQFISVFAIPLCFGLIAIADPFSNLFFGDKFVLAATMIKIMAPKIICIAWTTIIGYQYLLATNQTKKYTISVFLGALVSILINVTLTPHLTYIGASLAVVCSELVVTIYQLLATRKQLRLREYMFPEVIKYFVGSIFMFVVISLINSLISSDFVSILVMCVVGVLLYVLVLLVMKAKIFKVVKNFFGGK